MKGLAVRWDPAAAAAAGGLSKREKKMEQMGSSKDVSTHVNIKPQFPGFGALVNLVSYQSKSGRLTTRRKLR